MVLELQLERYSQRLTENKDSATPLGTAAITAEQAGLDVHPAQVPRRARVAGAL